MKMYSWILVAALALLRGVSGQFGICAEMCVAGGCPDGQACLSNGCGHTCQDVPTTTVGLEQFCPDTTGMIGICVEGCGSFSWGGDWALQKFGNCPAGQACCSNGCGHVCMPVQQHRVIPAGRQDLADLIQDLTDLPIMCALYCPCGYSGPCSCQQCVLEPLEEFPNLPILS
ncbi:PREDICTED: WAP four-disulfide core domain protein 3-like [Branchiostoma belcheri]|uniref:WAP four-disulfide core domain protein 3-like n=1 Tax=Branchiostoma belcheri TaxID=7741 RepID=A0A6P4Y0Y8_BRABE|nr:PREDICTED: WAP four-disulfide core domain protein 3-like [Branchiostoma belcheri]